MKRLILILGVFSLILFQVSPAGAVDISLHAAAGVGYEDTMAYDLYLQFDFDPWLDGDGYALSPLLQAGMFYWLNDDENNDAWGGVAAFGLQLVLGSSEYWRFYIAGSFGPTIISLDRFASRNMGGTFQFRSRGMLGIRFGQGLRHDIHLHASHYSNAGIYNDNEGYNAYGISYGFTF